MQRKILIAVTGASGAVYAKLLCESIKKLPIPAFTFSFLLSDNAKEVWSIENGSNYSDDIPFTVYEKNDFSAPFASGSAKYDTMIVIPCSMGTLGRIANGISNDLLTRAADVILKERRKLILVCRETPLSLIHIRNMETITLAGGIVCPASPSFYGQPSTIEEACKTVVDRVMDLANLPLESTYRWGE